MEFLGYVGAHAHEDFHRGALGHGLKDLVHHVVVSSADDGLDTGTIVAVNDVVLGEHVGCGDGNSPQFVQGQHAEPPLVVAFQDEHHLVSPADAQLLVVGCRLVALLFQVSKREALLLAAVACPEQGRLVGGFLCPRIHHIVGEIKVFGHLEVQVPVVVFL